MLPPPAFLTTEARLAPKGAAIDNAFHHTRCCCAFSSFRIFCVACTSWFSAALCSGNLNFVAAREPLHTKVAHLDGRINFCGAPPSSGLPPDFSRPSPSDPFSLARPCASDSALDQTCYDGGWDWSRRRIRVSRMTHACILQPMPCFHAS